MINDTLKNYMYSFIEEICNDIGPRESGTEQEIQAGNRIEQEMQKFCDITQQEEYNSHPKAFLGFIRYGALLGIISVVLYWLSFLIDVNIILLSKTYSIIFVLIAIILMIITFSYFILEVMRYHEAFDFLFPKKKSKNVIGTLKPSESVKRTVIISAHHDSAYEFNLFYYLKRFGQITITIGYIGAFFIFVALIIKLIFYVLTIAFIPIFYWFGIIMLFFTPIILLYSFFHSYKSVLGAFDNLSGVVILLGIAKFLSDNKTNQKIYPRNTEVRLISFAGEEAGLRGAKRYVKSHLLELKKNNLFNVNIDSIAIKDKMVILKKETLIGAKHDFNVYNPLYEIAKKLKIEAKIGNMPFGATDAAVFSKHKIPSATLTNLDLNKELLPFYHTRREAPEVVDKESLSQTLQICLKFIEYVDNLNLKP